MSGEWILHKEERVRFWSYPVKRTRIKKRLYAQNGSVQQALSGRYRTYLIHRVWYSTVSRSFMSETEEVRTFAQETAEGYAVYDWRDDTMHMPVVATSEI